MRTITDYKNAALDALEGNWGKAVALTVVVYVVLLVPIYGLQIFCVLLSDSKEAELVGQLLGNVAAFLLLPLSWAYVVAFLRLLRRQEVGIDNLWDGFRQYLRIFTTMLLRGIYTFLWALLLIVPGIMKAYSYAMTDYILVDNPELSDDRAISKSKEMMEGHRMDLFLLHLSFIGWALLALLTCGLGFLLLYPYMETAQAAFYEDLKQEQQTSLQE